MNRVRHVLYGLMVALLMSLPFLDANVVLRNNRNLGLRRALIAEVASVDRKWKFACVLAINTDGQGEVQVTSDGCVLAHTASLMKSPLDAFLFPMQGKHFFVSIDEDSGPFTRVDSGMRTTGVDIGFAITELESPSVVEGRKVGKQVAFHFDGKHVFVVEGTMWLRVRDGSFYAKTSIAGSLPFHTTGWRSTASERTITERFRVNSKWDETVEIRWEPVFLKK
jgi:hypothetical protein